MKLRLAQVLLGLSAFACGGPLLARDCDVLLTSTELESELDSVLDTWSALVRERHLSIVPTDQACYVHIRLLVSLPLGDDCTLNACSVANFEGQNLGLKAFELHGCRQLFSIIPMSPHVPASLTDVSDQIRTRCGSGEFKIATVQPVASSGGARVRVHLRQVASDSAE